MHDKPYTRTYLLKSKYEQETSISLYQNARRYKIIRVAKKQTYTRNNYFPHQNGKPRNTQNQLKEQHISTKRRERRMLPSSKKTKEVICKNLEMGIVAETLDVPAGEAFPYQFLLRSFDKKCKISRYSHTNVTINPKAANHDI